MRLRPIRRYAHVITASESFNGSTSDLSFGTAASQDYGPRTLIALVYPTGTGENGAATIWSKVPSGSNDGPIFNIQHNSNAPGLQFRQGSTGSSAFPARNAANSTVTYNAWNLVAVTYAGGLTATTDIKLYNGISGATLAECSYGGSANGTGSVRTGSGNTMYVGDRAGTDRCFAGSIAYVASFNSALSLADLQAIQDHGPAAFYGSCTFLWSNGRDYGPNALTGTPTNVTSGTTPTVDNFLGFSGSRLDGRLAA